MGINNIIELLGGIALFLFGMFVMGDALKRVAGNRLEVVLYRLTSNPFKGILLGTAVTAVIQSSSATSVMVVGFVNSGMMKVKQAIGIIMGAIIGTSVTGWILCLNSIGGGTGILSLLSTTVITCVMAVIGIILRMFSKKVTAKHVGDILLGFAVLMYGMSVMSGAVKPLQSDPAFIGLLTEFSNPLLGILLGLVFTSIIQSASAAVGILQVLATTGAISFEIALPIIMGIGIGASVPVLLSALGATVNGKRTAFIYLFIDVFGAAICSLLFYGSNAIFDYSFMNMEMTMVTIALMNSVFRIVTVLILSPFIGLLKKLVYRIFPENPEEISDQQDMDRLEERFIANPSLAIEQIRLVITSMAKKSKKGLFEAMNLGKEFKEKGYDKVNELEAVVDRYEDKLGTYMMKVSSQEMSPAESRELSKHLHVLTDFERISDHSKKIAESYKELEDKKIDFSGDARGELDTVESAVTEVINNAIEAFLNDDIALAEKVEPLEEAINRACAKMKQNHIKRLQHGACTLNQGFVFNDFATNYERVADHASNIAIAVLETQGDNYDAHEYMDVVKKQENSQFQEDLKFYKEKYKIHSVK